MRHKKIYFCALICIILSWAVFLPAQARENQESPFVLSVSYGMGGYVKDSSLVPVTLTITHKNQDFSGQVQLIHRSGYGISDTIAYTKDVFMEKGEAKAVEFVVSNMDNSFFDIKILDEKQNLLFEQSMRARLFITNDVYLGLLTDDFDVLGYMDSMPFFVKTQGTYVSTRLAALNKDNLAATAQGLSIFDAIIINDFDIRTLSKAQYEALKGFVDNGGFLFIGTGANASKTLDPFLEDYLTGSVGAVQNKTANFGLNGFSSIQRSDALDYTSPQIEYMEPEAARESETASESAVELLSDEYKMSASFGEEDNIYITNSLNNVTAVNLACAQLSLNNSKAYDELLCQTVEKGKGSVVVFSFDLGAEPFCTWGYNSDALKKIFMELTEVSVSGNIRSGFFRDNYYIQNMVSNYIADNLPGVGRFAVIILIYILLVAPVTYLILKKLDKQQWMWICVPGLALVFTVLVFFAGSMSRQKEPYVNYAAILTPGEGNILENTFFCVTSPGNKTYSMEMDGDYFVSAALNENYYYTPFSYGNDGSKANDGTFDINIYSQDTYTRLDMARMNAFESQYFSGSRSVPYEGGLDYDISYVEDHYEGTVTNHTGYTLEDAALIFGHNVIAMGTLAPGDSFSIDAGTPIKENISYYDLAYVLLDEDVQKQNVLYGYILGLNEYPYGVIPSDSKFVAFVRDYPTELAKRSGYQSSGLALLAEDVSVNYTQNEQFYVPNIFYEASLASGDLDGMNYSFYSDTLVFDCQLEPEDGIITGLKLTRPCSERVDYFLYNFETKTFEPIFEDGQTELKDMDFAPYMDGQTLRLKVEKAEKDMYENIYLPVITLIGRTR